MPLEGFEKRIVKEWEDMGFRLGYSEIQMRQKQERTQSLGSLVGCSWHRCILHKQVPHIKRTMFQDTNRCGKAQYCSGKLFGSLFTSESERLPAETCQLR